MNKKSTCRMIVANIIRNGVFIINSIKMKCDHGAVATGLYTLPKNLAAVCFQAIANQILFLLGLLIYNFKMLFLLREKKQSFSFPVHRDGLVCVRNTTRFIDERMHACECLLCVDFEKYVCQDFFHCCYLYF